MNTAREVVLTGAQSIFGNAPVDWRDVLVRDAPGDLLNVQWHPEMRGAIAGVKLTRGAQGLAIHGGDFRRQLVIRDIDICDLTPVMRDGRLNGDAIDTFGSHRLTMEYVLIDNVYGGVKLAGDNHILRHAKIIGADYIGVMVNGRGSLVEGVELEDCVTGIEARPGLGIIRVRTTASRRCGLLATGSGAVIVIDSDFDSTEIDAGTTLYAVNSKLGRIVRNDGVIV